MTVRIELDDKQRIKNIQLFSIGLIFLLPILLAKMMLNQGVSGQTTTSGGELITPITGYQQLNLDNPSPNNWQFVYVTSKNCDQPCKNSLYNIHQIWRALGAEMPRVKLILKGLTNEIYSSTAVDWRLFQIEEVNNDYWLNFAGQVLIVDPLGNFVMRYEFENNKKQSLTQARNMLKDAKRLLKLSRIG